jgi:ubiquinone/menaquinone biosynthesis C-methylase UbiE
MQDTQRAYLPAAGHDWALPLYDPLVRWLGIDAARRSLIEQAALGTAHRVLDIGCGTGTLATLIKRLYSAIDVVGLDPDPNVIARGRRKARRAGVSIEFDQGFSDALPYPDGCFDRVFSSFMFHHLEAEDRVKTLREVRRVLKPHGSFHLLDFTRPEAGSRYSLTRLFHSSRRLKDNSEARILGLLSDAGFNRPGKVAETTILFGQATVTYYRALRD